MEGAPPTTRNSALAESPREVSFPSPSIRVAAMMVVTVVLISTLVRARVCSRLLCTWSLWLLVVRAGCTIHMLETRWVSLSWNSVTFGGIKTRRKAQWTKVGKARSKVACIGERAGEGPSLGAREANIR